MQELCPAQEIPQQVGGEPTISMTALLELRKDADPEMKDEDIDADTLSGGTNAKRRNEKIETRKYISQ